MRISSFIGRLTVALICISTFSSLGIGQSSPHYLIANDDGSGFNSVSFYTIGNTGALTLAQQVQTGGQGIAGGYFGADRLSVLNSGGACVFASDALTGGIVGIDINTLVAGPAAIGSQTDSGAANGIGLAMNSKYLYAAFTSSNTIGTFQVQAGCSLTFVSDVSVIGLQGGFVDGMAINGNIMVVTYGDGSIQSFSIASGPPVSNGDAQNSTGYSQAQAALYPTSVEITADGHYALFGDTATSSVVEVSDISSGKLKPTVVYNFKTSISSSNILLSPDETLLYISNTQGDTISAALFNKTTGKLSPGCVSGKLKGYSTNWSYLSSMMLRDSTGSGGLLYVAEYGATPSIGMVGITTTGGKCTLSEAAGSPFAEVDSAGLLSIESFPPRAF
jgi:6-phosphogluconolactonase (cycloisomerase 2 family)